MHAAPHAITAQRLQRPLAQRDHARRRCAARGRGRSTASSATTRPGRGDITTTRSASTTASSTSWVTSSDRARLLAPARSASQACISCARDRVERRERLVEAQHRLAGQQRAHERDALAHPAATARAGRARSKPPGRSARTAARALARAFAADAAHAQRERRVVERARPRQQQVALGHQHGRAGGDRARVGRLQPADQLQQRRLAAAARADDRDDLAAARRAATLDRATRRTARRTRRAVPRDRSARDGAVRSLDLGRIAPSAGITPQVRRVSAGSWALSQPAVPPAPRLNSGPCYAIGALGRPGRAGARKRGQATRCATGRDSSDASSSTSANAATTAGSNCVPRSERSSAMSGGGGAQPRGKARSP